MDNTDLPLDPGAYCHLPQLRGCLTPAEQSKVRVTPDTLATWDTHAAERGLPADWRWTNAQIEASRRALLGDFGVPQDLWVFGYGSLMWDPGIHFAELRQATLAGHVRRFSYKTELGRGTPECPALTLALEPDAGCCHGLVFRIPAALVDAESAMLWRREMVRGGYLPKLLPMVTPQGPVTALAFAANPAHDGWAGALPLAEAAAIIARACGNLGRNLDYLQLLQVQLQRLGIDDDYIAQLWAAVQAEARDVDAQGVQGVVQEPFQQGQPSMMIPALMPDPNDASGDAQPATAAVAPPLRVVAEAARKRPRPGERRVQILQTLAAMLEQPGADRITTAALAARLQVSEAALYRHFASKAQMFEGLIEFIESSVFTLVNQIAEREAGGALQARRIVVMLLQFGEKNPGMVRVMVGDALVFEHERLTTRMNQFFDRVEGQLRQSLRSAADDNASATPTVDASALASGLTALVQGRLQRFARSGFKRLPTEHLDLLLTRLTA